MKTFNKLIEDCLKNVKEIFPWDYEELNKDNNILIVDVREPYEFEVMHIKDSINAPRGILETACEYNYEETIPELAAARNTAIVLVCRSGNRSIFAAEVMQQMGYKNVVSLRTGLRGWNDSELPLVDSKKSDVDIDDAEKYFTPNLKPEQLSPK